MNSEVAEFRVYTSSALHYDYVNRIFSLFFSKILRRVLLSGVVQGRDHTIWISVPRGAGKGSDAEK